MKKVFLIVSIDTECDKDENWRIPHPMGFKNIIEQQNILFPLFRKYNIKPTYLLSPEVIKDKESVDFFLDNKNWVELGTHMHVEFIKPNEVMYSTNTNDIQRNCSKEVEFEKLVNLTNLFKDKFGYAPTSFRSGRFGSSDSTTMFLTQLGYKVDSSVVPYTVKNFKLHKINSWGKNVIPFWEVFNSQRILQVPLTLINQDYDSLPYFLKIGMQRSNTFTRKVVKKLGYSMKTRWLRPYRESHMGMLEISNYVINTSFKKSDFAILNIMFHSNEILPGASPYCQTHLEVEEFRNSLDDLFKDLSRNYQICSIGLSDLYEVYSQS